MKTNIFLTVLLLILLSFSAFVASGGLHFVGNTGFGSGSLIINVDAAGFGGRNNAVVVAHVTGSGLTPVCKKHSHYHNGANTVDVDVTASQTSTRNGRAEFTFHLDLTQGIEADDAGCMYPTYSHVSGLMGTIYVNLQAFVEGEATPADTLNFVCYVNDPDDYVQCTEQ